MALWFKLRREPQKAPYQVFVLDFQFADRQPIRDFAKRLSELYTLCSGSRLAWLRPKQRNQSAVAPLCRVPTGNLIWNDLREHYGTSIRQTSCRHVRYSCARPNRSILGSFRARAFSFFQNFRPREVTKLKTSLDINREGETSKIFNRLA